jgi:hypothetical protein
MQPKGGKLHKEKATQMDASFYLKLHKRIMDTAKQEQSFRQNKPTQSSLQAARSKGGEKWMKPKARKLHKAVNNNNVFEAVRFTCATA